jgi:adenine-specific DNA-methyltransferase
MAKNKPSPAARIEATKHKDSRTNIPTEELRDFVAEQELKPKTILYPRDPSLDPQLVWKGKDEQDAKDLEVPAVPIYIQEKIHPQAVLAQWMVDSRMVNGASPSTIHDPPSLFDDFNGLTDFDKKVDFYHHDQHWSNRMILGDSLMVMTSLAEKEGLKGKVQTIYFDPPYGIKFGSNWQVSTRKRDVKDGKAEDMTRQPEQIKAFRDTYVLGIHSYLAYLRDRLVVARELLTETGSIFVQIGDANVHLVRAVVDEVFGSDNFVAQITFAKTTSSTRDFIGGTCDFLLFYAKKKEQIKFRSPYVEKSISTEVGGPYSLLLLPNGKRRMSTEEKRNPQDIPREARVYRIDNLQSQSMGREKGEGAACWFPVSLDGKRFLPSEKSRWKTNEAGMAKLKAAGRLEATATGLYYVRFIDDFPAMPISDMWSDTVVAGFASDKKYVVETSTKVVERCLLMTTDPGDLVLDPTCGSGTTAYVAEQWGRRWITTDTSRVALALARTRLMTARFPYYLLSDSPEGVKKEAELTGKIPPPFKTDGDIRKGFVYQRVPHVTLKSIANNPDIKEGMSRKQIDEAIARHAETETLYDKPYEDKGRLRVTGPFTVESLSPHRTISVEQKKEAATKPTELGFTMKMLAGGSFTNTILENLKKAGVQNTDKRQRLKFDSLEPYPGEWICGEGRYRAVDGGVVDSGSESPSTIHSALSTTKRAAICIGPEYGTVGQELVKEAAKEAVRGVGFDILIVCGFAFDPHVSEETKRYGKLTVLAARMNPDLAMGDELLKKTGAGNLFMVFGEPDLLVESDEWMVDRGGRRIARFEQFKRLSGLGSLEEINRAGKGDLPNFREVARGRAVRADVADAAGGGLDSGKHRRRGGEKLDGGIHSIPVNRAGLGGGSGDAARAGGGTGTPASASNPVGDRKPDDHPQNAFGPDEVTAIQTLTPDSFPLSTIHQSQVTILGVDVYDPTTGEIRSNSTDDIACWFIDTNYNGESFFVRHAYFTGADEPYEKLKNALRAEIDEGAWSTLYSTRSRPFEKPPTGRIAVKVINHYGDEVLKVYPIGKNLK